MKSVLVVLLSTFSLSAFAGITSEYSCGTLPSNGPVLPERVKHYSVFFNNGNACLLVTTTSTPAARCKKMKLINSGISGQDAAYVLKDISVSVIGQNVSIGKTTQPEIRKDCQRTH